MAFHKINFSGISQPTIFFWILLSAFFIYIPEHECIFYQGFPFSFGAMLDFLVTFILLLIIWLIFKNFIITSDFLRKPQSVFSLKFRLLLIFLLQMAVIVLIVKWYLNSYWGQSVMSFITDEFGSSVLFLGSWYVIAYFFISHEDIEKRKAKPSQIKVKLGGKVILVNYNEIQLIQKENHYAMLYLSSGKRYPIEQSLKKLSSELPTTDFFRINRKVILSINTIKNFSKIENRKIKVEFTTPNGLLDSAIISRYKAKSFEEWLGGLYSIFKIS